MKKNVIASVAKQPLAVISAACLLVACGDTVENVYQSGMEVVASADDLPKCSKDNEDEQIIVKDEASIRICIAGDWVALEGVDGDYACKTEELKDGSGLKIVCNGDSIGVVLNGSDGKDGKSGKDGKDGTDGEDGKDAELPNDTLEADSERVAVSLDSLAGYSQKGPFLKGSTVYLYELSDGRTLKQTNGNFTSIITRDDGRYKFTARDLASQYAMIVVEGYYRNEVTGKPSNASIRLRAITDMRKRSDANINLLTHLEFDRVYYLVTREKKTVKQAKAQAQKEIFTAFHIDTTEIKASAEDLDVFGKTDADAALLAISVLLQGDGSETDLSVLLTEISDDLATDGKWDGPGSDTLKAKIADWAVYADGIGRLRKFREFVGNWHLSENDPPAFEKFVRNFVAEETKLGKCGDKTIPVGTVKKVDDPRSKYYAKDYVDTAKTRERFICADADSAWWRLATDIEKDTVGWGTGISNGHEYEVRPGQIYKGNYYYNDGNGEAWREAEAIEYDTYDYENNRPWPDTTEGTIRRGAVAGYVSEVYENLNNVYVYMNVDGQMKWRVADNIERTLGGCVALTKDSVGEVPQLGYYLCKQFHENVWKWVSAETVESDTYKLPCKEDGSVVAGVVIDANKYVCDASCDENGCRGKFRSAEDLEVQLQLGCTEYNRGYITKGVGEDGTFYKCYDHWKLIQESLGLESVGYYKNADGATYNVVYAEHQIWMTKNLDVNVEGSYCYDDADSNCTKYGRLYSWDAAMSACPEGWHLPSKTEWVQLTDNGKKGHYLMDPVAWEGTGQSGFDVLPAGYRECSKAVCGDYYCSKGDEAMFWSSETDPEVPNTAYYEHFSTYGDYASWAVLDGRDIERRALSVRCVLD